MTVFSKYFGLTKSQSELDFIDVRLDEDTPLFVDPFAISLRRDQWSQDAHLTLVAFFQHIIECIREGREETAKELLNHLNEPNETRLGLSRAKPSGAGIGTQQAELLFRALKGSKAVTSGVLTSLEECELMVEGVGRDKISDLATNVLRGMLASYTTEQCELHNIPTVETAVGLTFSVDQLSWVSVYGRLPVADGEPVLLVPKIIARYDPIYNHGKYYRRFVLEYLKAEHLEAGTSLVRALKGGGRRVYKKDLEASYPCSKRFLLDFSEKHPSVLTEYRNYVARQEKTSVKGVATSEDEWEIAKGLMAALRHIEPGNESASRYHDLMVGVLELVFFPQLLSPRKEQPIHQGRKRIDIRMENAAEGGPFYRLHAVKKIPCGYIFFECKNYSREIANPELDQIAQRFSPNRGRVGFVLCRSLENRALFVERCRDTFRDDRGLVIVVDDETVLLWLNAIVRHDRQEIADSITALIDEVVLS